MYCLPFALPLAPLSFVITERESATEIVIVKPAVLPNTPGAMLDEVLDRAGLRGSSGEASPRREALFGLPIRADAPLDISARVNEAARTHLDRIAVSDATARLTYREFVSARDRFAAAMCVAAGRPLAGERVAVVMNRSVDAFLCVHACLELNAAFVPVDPAYPDARIRTTIDELATANDTIFDAPGGTINPGTSVTLTAAVVVPAGETRTFSLTVTRANGIPLANIHADVVAMSFPFNGVGGAGLPVG